MTGITRGLSEIAYMKPVFSHFSTSFLTTSFITGFSLLRCSIEVLTLSSKRILCIQIEGLIPFRSSIDQAIAFLYFLRISNSFFSASLVNPAEMMTGFAFSGCKKAYFKCSSNSFKIKPLELVFTSIAFSS